MEKIPEDIVALGLCVAALDELMERDYIKLARLLVFLDRRYEDGLRAKFEEVKNQKKLIDAELTNIQKVMEADLLDCIKVEDGKHYIDENEWLQKRAKNAKRLNLPRLSSFEN